MFSFYRGRLHWLLLLAILGGFQTAEAQSFPSRPISLVVPFAAGGGTDSIARDMAKLMSERLGQTVLVENRGGAGGALGADAVAKAKADGHTLLFATSTFATHAAMSPRLPYDPIKDFASVAMIGRGPLLVVGSRQLGARTLTELIAIGKTKAGGLNYCSAGEGSINHLAGELFSQKTGLAMTHVPFKGSGPATVELLAGRVDLFMATVPTILTHVKESKLPVLAVTGAQRSPLFPDVPTMAQAGVADFEMTTWVGMLVPKNTSSHIINVLSTALLKAVALPEVAAKMQACCSARMLKKTPEAFAQYMRDDQVRWAKKITEAGVKPE